MSSVTTTVVDHYRFVVGVDTHAASHGFAVVTAPNGAPIDEATVPTTAPAYDAPATGSPAVMVATSTVS